MTTNDCITKEWLTEPGKICVIDGVAGSGKTYAVNNALKNERSIGFYTATHYLKREHTRKYLRDFDTIASGMFNTLPGPRYYSSVKDDLPWILVLDEVLQTSVEVFKAAIELNRQGIKIIMLTDSCQQLAPYGDGEMLLTAFNELITLPECKYICLDKTFRALDPETEEMFYIARENVKLGTSDYTRLTTMVKHIDYEDLEYSVNDTYLVLDNAMEIALYDRFGLRDKSKNIPLIGKGTAAKRDIRGNTKIPVYPQAQIPRGVKSYAQVANVSSICRAQGSEVDPENTLYLVMGDNKDLPPRSYYVALTRCRSLSQIVIVHGGAEKHEVPAVYFTKPVKTGNIPVLTEDIVLADDDTVFNRINSLPEGTKTMELPYEAFSLIKRCIKELEEPSSQHYHDLNTPYIVCNGVKIYPEKKKDAPGGGNMPGARGLLNKMPEHTLMTDCLLKVYQNLEEIARMNTDYYPGRKTDGLAACFVKTIGDKDPDDYRYELDISGAYPTAASITKIPYGNFYDRKPTVEESGFLESEYMTIIPESYDIVDYYIVGHSDLIRPEGSIITGELVRFIQDLPDFEEETFFYLGSFDCVHGCSMGETLYDNYHKSKEIKEKQKEAMHWGYYKRPFLSGGQYSHKVCDENNLTYEPYNLEHQCINFDYYEYHPENVAELIMCSIQSEIALILLKIKQQIFLNDLRAEAAIITDAIRFDYNGRTSLDIWLSGIKDWIPDKYDWRVTDKQTHDVIIQTYKDLPTDEEYKKIQKSNRDKKYRESKKEDRDYITKNATKCREYREANKEDLNYTTKNTTKCKEYRNRQKQ